ncbi:iron-containing alcohol dehydrogenase [Rhizobium sp. XQZ8]|uniref:iron-containing alcohol dehydrogenase n=1 Tax=Rhizobium populisoli TaxID=2859785 RepID=UPI001CA5BD51|nr:iron-containing alcohol dehydrogenase [Rhizobium populisoli]MBW6422283.1 iron-containing alcohol dehydrogenase [Rhizobium populisoli]
MTRIFRAPAFYIQGPGALAQLGEKAATLGRSVVAICDALVLPHIEADLAEALHRQDIVPTVIPFDADVTHKEMDRLAEDVRRIGGEVVVGIGGGRTLDTAKGVARRAGLPFISVPTVASTDAPSTRGIVIYDDQHTMIGVEQMDANPAFVIVDTAIIAKAPARFLRGGIGDALTAKFETEGAWKGTGLSKQGTRPLKTGVMLGEICYRMLLEHGPGAMRVAGTGEVTADFEAVIEAVLWLSAVAFENTGLSIAHAVATELGAIEPVRKQSLHGEHAAYGTLVQAVAEGRSADELKELFSFCDEIGMPRRLVDLGLPVVDDAAIEELAAKCTKSPFMVNQARKLDADDLATAFRSVENYA